MIEEIRGGEEFLICYSDQRLIICMDRHVTQRERYPKKEAVVPTPYYPGGVSVQWELKEAKKQFDHRVRVIRISKVYSDFGIRRHHHNFYCTLTNNFHIYILKSTFVLH